MTRLHTRRRFLAAASLASTAILVRDPRAWAEEPVLETTTVRFGKSPVICYAPQYVCEALLRADGFTDVRYVDSNYETLQEDLGKGKFDFHSSLSLAFAIAIDRGVPITVVTPVVTSCLSMTASAASSTSKEREWASWRDSR